jgi:hypothetical protein
MFDFEKTLWDAKNLRKVYADALQHCIVQLAV